MARNPKQRNISLTTPDSPYWPNHKTYSSHLAGLLNQEYDRLFHQRIGPEDYKKALHNLLPFYGHSAYYEQSLRLEYTLAHAYAGVDANEQAIYHLDNVSENAYRRSNWQAVQESERFKATLLRHCSNHVDSYVALTNSADAMNLLEHDGIKAKPYEKLDMALYFAGRAYVLGRFPDFQRRLGEAKEHITVLAAQPGEKQSKEMRLQMALFHWLSAQLARVRGYPLQAYHHASEAIDIFDSYGRTIDAIRINIVFAGCALDVAEAQDERSQCYVHTIPGALLESPEMIRQEGSPLVLCRVAGVAINKAKNLASREDDHVGMALAQLESVRKTRLMDSLEHREPTIGKGTVAAAAALEIGYQTGDVALQGQALTTFGDELLAEGQVEAARKRYSIAKHLLQEFELGGLALRPHRALEALSN